MLNDEWPYGPCYVSVDGERSPCSGGSDIDDYVKVLREDAELEGRPGWRNLGVYLDVFSRSGDVIGRISLWSEGFEPEGE